MDLSMEKGLGPDVGEEKLSLEVTTQCNCSCLHCFARAGRAQLSSLSLEVTKRIIEEGHNIGYRHLHFTGGEPLLWKSLFKALEYAYDVGYESVLLNTNGTLLTQETCRRLAAYKGLSLSISLEGTEALHDELRGKGSCRQTSRGIERALDRAIDLFIFTVARKSLLHVLPHFANDLYRQFTGINHLTLIQLFRNTRKSFPLSEELLAPQDILQLVRIVSLLNLFGFRTFVKNNPLVNVLSELIEMPWIPRAHPLYRQGSIIVRANQDIRLSHSSLDSFGKYETGMIQKVLTSDQYQKAVAPDGGTCPTCRYLDLCTKNGMIRPSEECWAIHPNVLYCKEVLDSVTG